ncbi:hypothetical protein JRQ81_011798 [Phrynocephalus forsythii]|uniref:Counting factor associated protein D n=1 Tax=Phrynocephalus forsythii TaxID=171643 RepID=A0A9Q1AQH1_9SAUR|nr:hypothetical protein JRQ81_011798 [Phrynocephalus forsythii]
MGPLLLLIWMCFLAVDCAHLHTDLQLLLKLGDAYHVTGIIKLPYAEIEEPFEAWFNETGGKSRIQYYHGQVITYQFSFIKPFGANFKVTPETTETKVNIRECFRVNGTSEKPIRPQSVFPNLTDFQPVGFEEYNGQHCTVLESISYWGGKKNTYKLWMVDGVPVHYEMQGYNTLLGSHYDKYEIDYTSFSNSFSADVFDLPQDISCSHWPGAGPENTILANPMQEFVGKADEVSSHHEHLFHRYKEKFRKRYTSEKEAEHRKHNLIHNMRYVHSKNRANLSYKLDVNHLADHTHEELAVMRGRLKRGGPSAVTPVKDQAVCGSCWSFATTGTLEGALFLKTGVLTSLSQQALIDCSWGFGNHACDGGEEWYAYEWIIKHGGIPSTDSYGPYMGQNGFCHYNQSQLMAALSGYVTVPSGNITALKAALYKHGPVTVNIDASHKSFAFYASGIYFEPNCGNKTMELDHAVLAVGYGELQSESYWLIKNSWSTYWGNDGYILMSMKENNCGVATMATYPVLA